MYEYMNTYVLRAYMHIHISVYFLDSERWALACKHGLAGSRHRNVRHGGGFHLLLHIHVAAVGPLHSAVVNDLPFIECALP